MFLLERRGQQLRETRVDVAPKRFHGEVVAFGEQLRLASQARRPDGRALGQFSSERPSGVTSTSSAAARSGTAATTRRSGRSVGMSFIE